MHPKLPEVQGHCLGTIGEGDSASARFSTLLFPLL